MGHPPIRTRNSPDPIRARVKENSMCFWKYVKTMRGQKTGIPSIRSQSGELVVDPTGIANVLNMQYKKVFCGLDGVPETVPSNYQVTESQESMLRL